MYKAILNGVVIGLGVMSGVTSPNSLADKGDISFSPMVGRYLPAKNRGLEDSNFLSLAIGYDISNNVTLEAAYLDAEADVRNSSLTADVSQLRLDGLYHLNQESFQPFLIAGLGEYDFSAANVDEGDTFANIGVGFKWSMSRAFGLRSEVRLAHGMDSGESDYLFGIGGVFKFNGGQQSSVKTVKTTNEVKAKDSDKDGVIDANDQCPGTALGQEVDESGCDKILDDDKDGVVNALDRCPDSAIGSKVDSSGCYVVLLKDVSMQLNVNFETNSDVVIAGERQEITELAEFLKQYPDANVVIEGHTDSSGAANYNKQLSQKRADAVMKILVEEFGLDAARLTAIGYGEEQPIVENDSAANRAKNRRVTAVVKAQTKTIVK